MAHKNVLNRVLVGALEQCDTKELVEDTFARFSITGDTEKLEHIIEAMGRPTTFFADGGKDIEARYSTVLSMFLTGEWKMNELYARMGF
jgi:hypothetical protein